MGILVVIANSNKARNINSDIGSISNRSNIDIVVIVILMVS